MGLVRIFYKLMIVLSMLVIAFFIILFASILRFVKIVNTPQIQKVVKIWYQVFLKIMDITVYLESSQLSTSTNKGSVVVSNHISWLDIVVLGSLIQTHFLSKDEVRRWPLIGWLAHQIGTLFIKRGGGGDVEGLKAKMLDYVNTGQNILFFPEGTTGTGDNLMLFRPRLFSTAIDSKASVIPISIKYGTSEHPHNVVPYGKEQTLVGNVLRLMAYGHVDVFVSIGQKIQSNGKTRDQLSLESQAKIGEMLNFNSSQIQQRYQRKAQ